MAGLVCSWLMAHAWLMPHGPWLMHTLTVRGRVGGGTIWRGRGSHGAADHVGGPRRPPNRLGYRRLCAGARAGRRALSRSCRVLSGPGVRGVMAALWERP